MEFTCKRGLTRCKICCSFRYKYRTWKNLLQIFFILCQLHFYANKVKLNYFLKIHIFLYPRSYWKLSILYYFLQAIRNYCTLANNFYGSNEDKISLKFFESMRFFLAVYMEKFKKSVSLSIFYFHIKIGKRIGQKFNNIKCVLSFKQSVTWTMREGE